jgi:uncharacterized protein YdiU (UPF0061 family)
MKFNFDNSYARLPDKFFARLDPTPTPQPRLIRVNHELALQLGLDPAALESPEGVEILAGNRLPPGSDPLAMAYAGHQFGNWVPQLGDGRAILLGEVVDRAGVRRDIQLKGAGRTPFSRMGDGRAVLGPVLREYLVSEAMAALGVPTTRALAAVGSGMQIMRQGLQPGAVFTRVARSHVRVGTFEYFGNRGDVEAVRVLADYVIERHYPHAAEAARPYGALLDAVLEATAQLIAQWQLIGFIHGVMNTDNTSVAGETIDFGPCAFMDAYHPQTVYSSIDTAGRYAYLNQPRIAHWNLAQFAQCLLPVLASDEAAALSVAQTAINAFPARFQDHFMIGMRKKLGLTQAAEDDVKLVEDLFDRMAQHRADFTLTFRYLCDAAANSGSDVKVRCLFSDPAAFDDWAPRWRDRMAREAVGAEERRNSMRAVNPLFTPRNHQVERVIAAAQTHRDFKPFEEFLGVLSAPFEDQPPFSRYAEPPRPEEEVQATFCGT